MNGVTRLVIYPWSVVVTCSKIYSQAVNICWMSLYITSTNKWRVGRLCSGLRLPILQVDRECFNQTQVIECEMSVNVKSLLVRTPHHHHHDHYNHNHHHHYHCHHHRHHHYIIIIIITLRHLLLVIIIIIIIIIISKRSSLASSWGENCF